MNTAESTFWEFFQHFKIISFCSKIFATVSNKKINIFMLWIFLCKSQFGLKWIYTLTISQNTLFWMLLHKKWVLAVFAFNNFIRFLQKNYEYFKLSMLFRVTNIKEFAEKERSCQKTFYWIDKIQINRMNQDLQGNFWNELK